MELMDQTALITGGSAGIGLAAARLLAREGTTVIITGRDAERGKAATAGVTGDVRFIQADVSDIDSVRSLVEQVVDVDILVNNAASFPSAITVRQDIPPFEKTFDTNVRGAYFLVAGLVPGMLKRGHGSIIKRHLDGRIQGCARRFHVQRLQGRCRVAHPYVGRRIRTAGSSRQQRGPRSHQNRRCGSGMG